MKCKIVTVSEDESVAHAAELMQKDNFGFLPVCDSAGVVKGVVTDRDIAMRVCAERRSPAEVPVHEIMTKRLVACSPADTVQHAEDVMMKNHKTRLLVMSDGKLVGILSLTDIAQCEEPMRLARVLREISSHSFRIEHP